MNTPMLFPTLGLHPLNRFLYNQRHWILITVSCGVLAFSSSSYAATSKDELPTDFDNLVGKIEQTFGGFAERQKEYIYGALLAFQRNANYGEDWNSTLSGIELQVPWTIFFDSPANAAASLEDTGDQHVALNMILMFQIHDKSVAAARYLIQDAIDVPLQQLDAAAADSLANLVERTIVAWSLAHEVAHHMAGNVDTKALSLQTARTWELEADEKAYEILNRSGYSLYLLSQYMNVMERLEALRKRAGQLDPESALDHPHWSTRSRDLQQYMASAPPVNQRWTSYSWFSHTSGESQVTEATYLLPSNDWEHLALLVTNSSSISMAAVEQKPDDSASVYIRNGDSVYEHRILKTTEHVTAVRIVGPGGFYTDYFCFRSGFAAVIASIDTSGTIANALRDSIEQMRGALRSAGISPAIRQQADPLLIDRSHVSNDLWLDFYRGEMTAEDYQARMQQIQGHYDARLKSMLGQQQYEEFTKILFADLASMIDTTNSN